MTPANNRTVQTNENYIVGKPSMKQILLVLSVISVIYSLLPQQAKACFGRSCHITLGDSAQEHVTVRYIYLTSSLPSDPFQNIQRTFETKPSGTQQAATDTVMMLVDEAGKVICRNDDIALANGGSYSFFSKLVLGATTGDFACPIPVNGTYTLLVRSFGNADGGTTILEEYDHTTSQTTTDTIYAGGLYYYKTSADDESFQVVNVSDKGEEGADTVLILIEDKQVPFIGTLEDSRVNDDGGVGFSAKVETVNNTEGFIVARWSFHATPSSPTSANLKLYHNDVVNSSYDPSSATTACINPKDKDCDGIGDLLEAELGTCPCLVGNGLDHPSCTTNSSCSVTHNARDTDGDGIPDSWEVFGRSGVINGNNHYLELPRFGSDPRQKDVFVEVDIETGTNQLTSTDLNNIFTEFSFGTATDLKNPNNAAGIRLHIDIRNFSPSLGKINGVDDTRYSYGDWGGSDEYTPPLLTQPMGDHRRGIFRHSVSVASGTINAAGTVGDSFSFNGVKNFLHELGHTLGLKHGGDPNSALSFNCKPNYFSVMNYATSQHTSSFSKGIFATLNPFSLNENAGMLATGVLPSDYSFLRQDGFDFDVDFGSGAVDWNRDGPKTGTNVKAFIFSPINDCYGGGDPNLSDKENYELVFHHKYIASNDNTNCPSNPAQRDFCIPSSYDVVGGVAAAYFNSKLYVVTIIRSATNNPQFLIKRYDGTTWNEITANISDIPLQGSSPTIGVTNNTLYISFINSSGQLKVLEMSTSESVSPSQNPNNSTSKSPTLYVDSSGQLNLFFLQNNLLYKQTLVNGSWTTKASQKYIAAPNVNLKGSQAPTLSTLGSDIYLFIPRDGDNRLEMYKQDSTNNLWQKLGLLYTANDTATDRPVAVFDNRTGYQPGIHLWYPQNDSYFRLVTKSSPTVNNPLFFNRVSFPKTSTSAPALVITPQGFASNTTFHAFFVLDSKLYYLPHGDGIINESIPSVNDWKVLAKFLCAGIATAKAQVGAGSGTPIGAGVQICEGTLSYH